MAVLFAVLASGEAVVTTLVALSVAVPGVAGSVVVNVFTLLVPGARLPTAKARTSPLDSVTVPLTPVATPPVALFVKVTVPLITEPAGAPTGNCNVVPTSARPATTTDAEAVLLAGLGSVVPTGPLTVATLVMFPVALNATCTW